MERVFGVLLFFVFSLSVYGKESRPNILFIAIDDLRPELGSYGRDHIKSPNIDRLAGEGLLFERAYTSVPTCGASRASLMTGVRPTPSRFVNYLAVAQEDAPWAVTMNTHFKKSGYRTLSYGKVFHSPKDHASGWSERPLRSKLPNHVKPENRKDPKNKKSRGMSWEMTDAPESSYPDGDIADKAVARIKELAKKPDEPFFFAVGFVKPHLPFCAPKKYWDLYPTESIKLPENYRLPTNVPAAANYNWGELRAYRDIPKKGPMSEKQAKQLIRGYYACVSFADAQVGKVLEALEKEGLAENTIVVLWGDHGWNLGDHTYWCKHTVYESSLHIPLIVKVPGLPAGKRTKVITESVDLYPTLCELAGVPSPQTLEGQSLLPLLKDPGQTAEEMAFSRYRVGDSIRFGDFRYSEYRNKGGKVTGRMLYNHKSDPLENENIVDDPKQGELVKKLAKRLTEARKSTRQK